LGTPLTVLYATDSFTAILAKYFLVQVDYMSLVNLLAGREVAPELYQRQVRGDRIAGALGPLLEDEEARGRQTLALDEIRAALEGGDPYGRAASRIRALLEESP
jgi:lipid-A-disaccharide synthase